MARCHRFHPSKKFRPFLRYRQHHLVDQYRSIRHRQYLPWRDTEPNSTTSASYPNQNSQL